MGSDSDSALAITARLSALPPPPRDEGAVVLVVVRPSAGARALPPRCSLTPESGITGDRWAQGEKPLLAAQVSVMRADVAKALAGSQPLELFGDNLFVDLDLSTDNLPTGTRLRIGTAVCEVTAKPHTGCVKFETRFGKAARSLTTADPFRQWRLRGMFLRILDPGEVAPGDRVSVIERPGA
jgi:hypothetical protein